MTSEEKKIIIEKLMGQHKILRKNVEEILAFSKNKSIEDADKISTNLNIFFKNFTEHIKLEDNVFYVELILDMKKEGVDTTNTEKFIIEMRKVEETINNFVEKYKNTESIKKNILNFYAEFVNVKSVFQIRIESEEGGVYAYWHVF